MSNLLEWLLIRADQAQPVSISVEQGKQWPTAEFDWWVNAGVLVPASPLEELACRNCPEQPIERIVWIARRGNQAPTPYLPCPICGPIQLLEVQLHRWRLEPVQLWTVIFGAVGANIQVHEIVAGHLWKVGHLPLPSGRSNLFVGCRLTKRCDLALQGIRFPSNSILFVSAKRLPAIAGSPSMLPMVSLLDLVGWDGEKVIFDRDSLVDQLPSSLASGRRIPRPARKRAERAANIEALAKLLKEHVEAARDHALATAEAGEAKVLPRPSQRDLAKLAGISEMAASRSFRDPTARELRLLWETAVDLDRLLALGPARSSIGRGR